MPRVWRLLIIGLMGFVLVACSSGSSEPDPRFLRAPLPTHNIDGQETLSAAILALDQVNTYSIEPAPWLALRKRHYLPDTELECVTSGTDPLPGTIVRVLEPNSVMWNPELQYFNIDWNNLQCHVDTWYDKDRGHEDEVWLRITGIAAVGYADFVQHQGNRQRNLSYYAGVLVWGLTQPFKLSGHEEAPFLTSQQAEGVLTYIRSRAEFIGNDADKGYAEHSLDA